MGTYRLFWSWTDALLGIVIGAAYLIVMTLVPGLTIGFPSVPAALADITKGVIIILVAPVLEEIVARGIIFGKTEDLFGTWIAMGLSAAFFAILHLYIYQSQTGALLGAAAFSLMAALALKLGKNGNLLIPMLAHGVVNAYLFNRVFGLLVVAAALPGVPPF